MSNGYRKYTICVQIIHEYALEGKIKADLLKSALNAFIILSRYSSLFQGYALPSLL